MGSWAELVSPPPSKPCTRSWGEMDETRFRVSGVDRLLQYPEFSNPDKMKEVLGVIEKPEEIVNMVSDPQDRGVNVVIGSGEHRARDG